MTEDKTSSTPLPPEMEDMIDDIYKEQPDQEGPVVRDESNASAVKFNTEFEED